MTELPAHLVAEEHRDFHVGTADAVESLMDTAGLRLPLLLGSGPAVRVSDLSRNAARPQSWVERSLRLTAVASTIIDQPRVAGLPA